MNEIPSNFDLDLHNAVVCAKRSIALWLIAVSGAITLLWLWAGSTALYVSETAGILFAAAQARDIADGYAEIVKDGFDFDYSVKTN